MSNDRLNEEAAMGLLDLDLADIEDLPGFEPPPTGYYIMDLETAMKQVADKWQVETSYTVVETVKVDKETEAEEVVVGAKFSSLYNMEHTDPEKAKVTKAKLKELLADIAKQVEQSNVALLVRDHIRKCRVEARVKRVIDKEDPERKYGRVSGMKLIG